MSKRVTLALILLAVTLAVSVLIYSTTAVRADIAIEPFPGEQPDFWIVNVGTVPILRIVVEAFDANNQLQSWTLHSVLAVDERLVVTAGYSYVLIHFEDYHGWQTIRIDLPL